MIEDARGCIDYDESGQGPTVVLVPGSCSTGAAWRPVIAAWDGAFRTVTTSLSGYGGTAGRRTAEDASIEHEADVIEAVVAKAGGQVHLVGHSFGAAAALAFALRDPRALASLTLIEMPPPTLLRDVGEHEHYRSFRRMTALYEADFAAGKPDAIETMIDFYGGAGTWQSWPPRVRDYACRTTTVNLVDWATAYALVWNLEAMRTLGLPTLVIYGRQSPPAMQKGGAVLAQCLGVPLAIVEGAAHFMIATHAAEVAGRIAAHVRRAEARPGGAAFATLAPVIGQGAS
jgi:pimeloyl-ACP methyl ester carboxylesterase